MPDEAATFKNLTHKSGPDKYSKFCVRLLKSKEYIAKKRQIIVTFSRLELFCTLSFNQTNPDANKNGLTKEEQELQATMEETIDIEIENKKKNNAFMNLITKNEKNKSDKRVVSKNSGSGESTSIDNMSTSASMAATKQKKNAKKREFKKMEKIEEFDDDDDDNLFEGDNKLSNKSVHNLLENLLKVKLCSLYIV